MEQQIRFCQAADGVRLACATHGRGAPLVKAANRLTHVEQDWDSPTALENARRPRVRGLLETVLMETAGIEPASATAQMQRLRA